MAEMGKRAVANTVWFQFCTTQVVAVIMLSASVSDEIYNRTLGLLMITPVTIWGVVPLLLAVVTSIIHVPEVAEVYVDTNPLVLLKVIMEATVGTRRLGNYYWSVSGSTGFRAPLPGY